MSQMITTACPEIGSETWGVVWTGERPIEERKILHCT